MSDELEKEEPSLMRIIRDANTKKANMLRERCKAIKIIRDRLARRSLNFVKKDLRHRLCVILDGELELIEREIADVDGRFYVFPINAVEYIDLEIRVAVEEALHLIFASYIMAECKNDDRLFKFIRKVEGKANFERF